jgi:hypothetical protein
MNLEEERMMRRTMTMNKIDNDDSVVRMLILLFSFSHPSSCPTTLRLILDEPSMLTTSSTGG